MKNILTSKFKFFLVFTFKYIKTYLYKQQFAKHLPASIFGRLIHHFQYDFVRILIGIGGVPTRVHLATILLADFWHFMLTDKTESFRTGASRPSVC